MGNCSYPSPPAGQLYVALSPAEYGAAAACGSYLQVTGPDGSVTVEVVDQCPECQAGHIDLSEQAFARIAPLNAGLVPVSYHTVADPPLPAPLSMLVKTGSSAYYLALLPINNGNPLASRRRPPGFGGLAGTSPDDVRLLARFLRRRAGPVHGPADRLPGPSGHGERHHDQPGRRPGHRDVDVRRGRRPRGHRRRGTGEESGPCAPGQAPAPRRARHRQPGPASGISVAEASSPPAAASPTPSCH